MRGTQTLPCVALDRAERNLSTEAPAWLMTSSLAGVTGVAPECLPAQIQRGFEHRLSTTSIYFACYFEWSVASS